MSVISSFCSQDIDGHSRGAVDCCATLRLAGRVAIRCVCGARHIENRAPGERRTRPCALAGVALASRLPRIRGGRREEPAGFIHKSAFNESDGLSQLYDRRLAYDWSDFGGGEKADIH